MFYLLKDASNLRWSKKKAIIIFSPFLYVHCRKNVTNCTPRTDKTQCHTKAFVSNRCVTLVLRVTAPLSILLPGKYSITSMARTRIIRLPWMIRTFFQSLQNLSNSSRKQIFRDFFLFYHGIVCCKYSLESPHRGDSNEYTHIL